MNGSTRHRRGLGLVVLVGALAVLAAASTAARATGTWTVLAPVPPAPTEGMQVGVVDGEIIAAYGNSGADTTLTRRYDIDANTRSFGSAAPAPARAEGAAATHGGLSTPSAAALRRL
jgi:hypothetical protein